MVASNFDMMQSSVINIYWHAIIFHMFCLYLDEFKNKTSVQLGGTFPVEIHDHNRVFNYNALIKPEQLSLDAASKLFKYSHHLCHVTYIHSQILCVNMQLILSL